VFVKSIDKEALTPLSERIMEVVREDIVYRNQILNVGVSVGVTYVDEPEQSMESIIKRADLAMYQAKNNGKSRIVIER
jgi:diguanylate cyclase (GGDEF)-like protein